MPELRQDPVTRHWVVISKERAKRPHDFIKKEGGAAQAACPFDYGRENMTPPEVLAFRPQGLPPDSPGWTVRVVPNKFAAFTPETRDEVVRGIFRNRPAYGAHEVIIHGPEHDLTLATYPDEQVARVIQAYKMRYEYHMRQPYGRYIQIIINHGKEAGASLEHSHSQLFAMPIVPPLPEAQLNGASDYYDRNGRCVFCDMVKSELDSGERVLEATTNFIAFVPYAATLPFKTMIAPIHHRPHFEEISGAEIEELAYIFRRTLRRFRAGLSDPPLNMYLHSSPPGYEKTEGYHWHMSIIPKLTIAAGFELGTNMWINVTIPEAAAEFLKNVDVNSEKSESRMKSQ